MLEHCCNHLNQCCNNFATPGCAKNCCCESPRVTSPLNALTTSVLTCCLYLFAQSRSSRISVSPSNIPNTAMRQAMNQTRGKFKKTCRRPRRGRGGGGVLNKFSYGEAPPRGPTPYPLKYHFSMNKVPLSYTFYWQMVPLSQTLFRTLHLFELLYMHCHLNRNQSQN